MTGAHSDYTFDIVEGCISHVHGDGDNSAKLCNFACKIIEEHTVTNGIISRIEFLVEGYFSDGTLLPAVSVPAERFNSLGWVSQYGSRAIIYPVKQVKDLLPLAIRMISGVVPKKTVVSHTGWVESPHGHVYMTNGSVIGTDGDEAHFEVAIEDPHLRKFSINPGEEDHELEQSLRACLALAQMNPSQAILPLIGATFLAPLQCFIPLDFSVFLHGVTGSFKSQLTMLCQSHYGRQFHNSLPGNWASTENALEIMTFLAKDAVFVVDDFTYLRNERSSLGYKELEKKAERIFRGQGNSTGRQRMGRNDLARSYHSRAMIMTSGETLPRGDSLLARLFVVQLGKGDIDSSELSQLQQYAAAGLFENAMAGYIKWLSANYDRLKDHIPAEIERLREYFSGLRSVHFRTPENTAKLFLGFGMFIYYMKAMNIVSESEAASVLSQAEDIFLEVGRNQNSVFVYDDTADLFFDQLVDAMAQGAGHFNFIHPDEFFSFVGKEFIGWTNIHGGWQKNGRCLGWVAGENLYLLPAISYDAAHKQTKSKGFTLETRGRLWKRLHEQGLILSSDPDRIGTRKYVNGVHHRVVHLDFAECFKDTFRRRGEGDDNRVGNPGDPERAGQEHGNSVCPSIGATGTDDLYADL